MKKDLSIGIKIVTTLILLLYLVYGTYIFILPLTKFNTTSLQKYTQVYYLKSGINLPNWYYKTGFMLDAAVTIIVLSTIILIFIKRKLCFYLILIGSTWNVLSMNIDLISITISKQLIQKSFLIDYFMVVIFWLFIIWFFNRKSVRRQFLN